MSESNINFTVEEIYLICIYEIKSREDLINEMSKSIRFFPEQELIEIASSVIQKLKRMSDAEFAEIDFYSECDYSDYDE